MKGRGKKAAEEAPAKEDSEESAEDKADDDEENGTEEEEEEEKLNGDGATVEVEHCSSWSVFKRRALDYCDNLKTAFPQIQFNFLLNPNGKPKRGSFEITFKYLNKTTKLWSGLDKGPPRKDKFPDSQILIDQLKNLI